MAAKKESEKHKSKQEAETHTETNSKSKTAERSAEFDIHQKGEDLVQALQGNLNEIETDEALSLIQEWYGFLDKTKDSSVSELATALKNLQKLLKGNKASELEISEALIELGENTSEFAPSSASADKGIKQLLQKLGKQLRTVGTLMAKAEEKEYHDRLDQFLEKADDQSLTTIKAEEATGIIDFWYGALNKAEDKQLKEIASSLKNLKQSLTKDNSKAEGIAKLLNQVSEQTIAASSEAPRGFKGMLQKVGKQLAATSDSLVSKK
jgi:predicted RND superfamily exporter protein